MGLIITFVTLLNIVPRDLGDNFHSTLQNLMESSSVSVPLKKNPIKSMDVSQETTNPPNPDGKPWKSLAWTLCFFLLSSVWLIFVFTDVWVNIT